MSEVYKATHPSLKRTVAIKILPPALAAEVDFRRRFQHEAKIVSQLQHPNIVRVLDFGEENETPYMVMEYLNGHDLAHYLQTQGRLTLVQALPIIRHIAEALDYAHQRGLVHRDIKPSNVMLEMPNEAPQKFRAVLMDFGIAKLMNSSTVMTQAGGVLGTFDYIAPEQIQASTELNGRADVYAFGVMVYQMLTGEVPFKHNNAGALLIAHLTHPVPSLRQFVPDLLEQVEWAIQRAMAKQPLDRFSTAGEFVQALG
jgi:serine/threonine protein kinase